ncbi:MAG: hypothetical protein BroJett005_21900 [Ignavibacteriota bacterium]|nr:MAG: hypothetical protein BroJett005_21900 [Ignavibacteriota bacterium]
MFYIKRNSELERISVSALYKLYKNEELDDSPYYQRFSKLWSVEKKRLLIDTIINGYDIPKFYFHYIISSDNTLNSTNKKYAIIDGKQRLNTIVEFFEDHFELDETVKWLDNTELKFNKLKYSDFSKKKNFHELKSKLDNFQLDIIHVTTDEFDRIEEMFLRLNEGVPVNNAEKRNSIGGYLIEGINDLVKSSDFFKSKVRFGNKRMEHQDLVSKFCLIESSTTVESFTKKNLDNLVKKFKPKKGSIETDKRRLKSEANKLLDTVKRGLNDLCKIFNDKDDMLKSRGIIPLYYLFLKRNPSIQQNKLKEFLSKFDKARSSNRKIGRTGSPNSTLLQFDRLNQQGAHQAKSLETRLKIMTFYFSKSSHNFKQEMPPVEIGIDIEEESV